MRTSDGIELKASNGRFLVAVEDLFENEITIIEEMSDVDRETAMTFAESRNADRRSQLDCIYHVYDDTGFCINAGTPISR